jgi:hypothetical protein
MKSSSNNTTTALDDDVTAQRILQSMGNASNTDAFRGYFYVNARSSQAVLIFRLTGIQGDDHWCWKPDTMTKILSEYFKLKPHADGTIRNMLDNLTHGPMVDESDETKEAQKIIQYTPRGGTRTVEVKLFTAFTYINIPVETLQSKQDEQEWLRMKITTFFDQLKIALQGKSFETVMKNVNPTYAAKIFDKSRVSNIYTFIRRANILIDKTEILTKFLTRPVAEAITNHLWLSRCKTTKYTIKAT